MAGPPRGSDHPNLARPAAATEKGFKGFPNSRYRKHPILESVIGHREFHEMRARHEDSTEEDSSTPASHHARRAAWGSHARGQNSIGMASRSWMAATPRVPTPGPGAPGSAQPAPAHA